MAWTDPSGHVWATGEIVTAANMNTYIGNNLIDLDRRTTVTSALVATAESTTSTAYTDLTTTGPAVTVTIGATGQALISYYSSMANNTAGQSTVVSFAVSGATTVAASDAVALSFASPTNDGAVRHSATFLSSGLNAGSNTFTLKYKVSANIGSFQDRNLLVTPLGS